MTKATEARKRDHLILAQDKSLKYSISAGFERWRFIHNALPELDLDMVDTQTRFLGKTLGFPLLISSMSGGVKESLDLNATLASAAEAVACAMSLGSIRGALEDGSTRDSFLIAREKAPGTVILANLGIAQILGPCTMDQVESFCHDLQADGLIIHLNVLQEAFQVEGDRNFNGALEAIRCWVRDFPRPIIVKEVGQGLSVDVISALEDVGVKHIDIAGAGGSHWINIERQRLSNDEAILKDAAHYFSDWGEPTAEVLNCTQSNASIIASGGVHTPIDMAKALALGADLAGVAGTFLQLGLSGDPDKLIHELKVWQKTLQMVMFGTGCANLDAFIANRSLLKKVDSGSCLPPINQDEQNG